MLNIFKKWTYTKIKCKKREREREKEREKETTLGAYFSKIIILYNHFSFYLSKYPFCNFFFLYLTMVNKLYAIKKIDYIP